MENNLEKLKEFFLKTTPNPSFLFFKTNECGFCKEISPLIKKYCNENDFFLYEIDQDDENSSKLFNLFDIPYFPTLIITIDGRVEHFLEGKNTIKEFLNS